MIRFLKCWILSLCLFALVSAEESKIVVEVDNWTTAFFKDSMDDLGGFVALTEGNEINGAVNSFVSLSLLYADSTDLNILLHVEQPIFAADFNKINCRIQFDDKPAQIYQVSADIADVDIENNSFYIYFNNPKKCFKEMYQSETVKIEVFTNVGDYVYLFRLDGFDRIYDALIKYTDFQ